MIHIGAQVPYLVAAQYPTFLSNANTHVLLPWRMAAAALHFVGILTVADYRDVLITVASLPPVYRSADFDYLHQSANWAVAASLICLAVCVLGIVSGRTVRYEALNFFHAVAHTIAGVLLVVVWYKTHHVIRLWHVFYIFGFIPAFVEAAALSYTSRSGKHIF